MINGNGALLRESIGIVIENNITKSINLVGYPCVELDQAKRPQLKLGGKKLNCKGIYLLSGFVDIYGHFEGKSQGQDAEYVFKLWMEHGFATIRDPSAGNGLDWVLDHKKWSIKNEITAPKILAYITFGMGNEKPVRKNQPIKKDF